MALQLKNKVKKENQNEAVKAGKYKRKRNVFGKRLTRFGLIGTIIFLLVAFVAVKVVFTLSQNKKQKKVESDLVAINQQIKQYQSSINKKADSYQNVGELIATLPLSFDRQATSLDLDRMVILSGLTESGTATRKMSQVSTMPFKCSVSTVKAVQITMTLYGKTDDVDSFLDFIDLLTNYEQENFYYIDSISYKEDRNYDNRSTTVIKFYTFYNEIELS